MPERINAHLSQALTEFVSLLCHFNGKGVVVEEWHNGQWQASPSQSVNNARFPVQILSQGQVAELACSWRQILLSPIIDDAASVGPLWQVFKENKLRRQLIIVTHNSNIVVNGDAELVHVMEFRKGQCRVKKVGEVGALQESPVRHEVCRVMEGGREAFARR